jgi:hypothetical protein
MTPFQTHLQLDALRLLTAQGYQVIATNLERSGEFAATLIWEQGSLFIFPDRAEFISPVLTMTFAALVPGETYGVHQDCMNYLAKIG